MEGKPRKIQWWDLRWEGSLIEDITVTDADTDDPAVAEALGAWADLSFPERPPALTCRHGTIT
eukprot:scaffold652196_cov47-Prasinocladus_malaysianus.AAC.1